MNPLFFGPRERQLFGVYHPAAGGAAGGRGMVICPPWGPEHLCAHRTLRILAERLAREGWHVLRFDWYGAGDSAGARTEGSVEQWLRDVDTAVEELKAQAGLKRVHLAGLRLGATLAAMGASGRDDVAGLVLWDPIVDGPAYLRELGALGINGTRPEPLLIGPVQVGGLVLTPAMARGIGALGPEAFGETPARRVLMLVTDPQPAHAALRERLAERVRRFEYAELDGPPAWIEEHDFGTGPVPAPVLERIASWRI